MEWVEPVNLDIGLVYPAAVPVAKVAKFDDDPCLDGGIESDCLWSFGRCDEDLLRASKAI